MPTKTGRSSTGTHQNIYTKNVFKGAKERLLVLQTKAEATQTPEQFTIFMDAIVMSYAASILRGADISLINISDVMRMGHSITTTPLRQWFLMTRSYS